MNKIISEILKENKNEKKFGKKNYELIQPLLPLSDHCF